MRGDYFPASDNLPADVTQADIDREFEGEPERVEPEYEFNLLRPLDGTDPSGNSVDIFDHISRSKREA